MSANRLPSQVAEVAPESARAAVIEQPAPESARAVAAEIAQLPAQARVEARAPAPEWARVAVVIAQRLAVVVAGEAALAEPVEHLPSRARQQLVCNADTGLAYRATRQAHPCDDRKTDTGT
jgi:hypothetical protein